MKYLYIILAVLTIKSAKSQNLTDYIPANAQFVFSMNLQQLNTKSNQMDYTKYLAPLISKSTGYYYGDQDAKCDIVSVEDIVKTPAEYGINTNQNIYIYKANSGDLSGTIFLFGLSDSRKFESRLKMECTNDKKMLIRANNNGKVFAGKTTSLSFSEKMAVVFIKDYSYYDYYGDYAYAPAIADTEGDVYDSTAAIEMMVDTTVAVMEEATEEVIEATPAETYQSDSAAAREREERIRLAMEKISDYMEKCLLPETDNYTSNRNFQKLNQGHHDAFLYFNSFDMIYKNFYPFYTGFYSSLAPPMNNKNRLLTSEMNSTYTLDFENGRAKVNILSNYNKNVYPYIKECYDMKQSKKLFKYIDGKNLLGYMSFAFNSEEIAKFYGALYREMFGKESSDLTTTSTDRYNLMLAMELFYAFIDKEVLYNTVRSQAIFACTGFEDVRLKYTTYEYDEDFKRKEKTEEMIEKQPKMVLASAIGNKENARKLFDIISRFTVFTRLKDNVFVFYGNRHMHLNVYFALTDDAFIITNDAMIAMNNLDGYKGDQQMAKADKAVIMKHNACMKIYGSKMMAGLNDAYFKKGESLPWFTQIMTNLGDIEMYDSKPTENSYGMTAVLNLKDNSGNALYQLLKMMSSINDR